MKRERSYMVYGVMIVKATGRKHAVRVAREVSYQQQPGLYPKPNCWEVLPNHPGPWCPEPVDDEIEVAPV